MAPTKKYLLFCELFPDSSYSAFPWLLLLCRAQPLTLTSSGLFCDTTSIKLKCCPNKQVLSSSRESTYIEKHIQTSLRKVGLNMCEQT